MIDERPMVKYFEGRIDDVADRLRRTADSIERHKERPQWNLRTMRTEYVGTAGRVVHDVTTMVANLHLDSLIEAALHAHEEARLIEITEARAGEDTA